MREIERERIEKEREYREKRERCSRDHVLLFQRGKS